MGVLARLWGLRSERPVFVSFSFGLLAFLLLYPAVDWLLRGMGIASGFHFHDFGAYGIAVERWLAGSPIYVPNENGGYHGSYLYPPIVLLVFWPFTELPFSRLLWNGVSVGFLWIGLQSVVSQLAVDLSVPERGLMLWALVGFQPLLLAIKLAQTPAFLTGLLCLSLVGLLRGGDGSRRAQYLSGALTAAVGTIKLTYSTAGAHLLAHRDRLLGALVSGGVLAVTSVLFFGLQTNVAYFEVLAWGFEQSRVVRSPALWLAPYYKPLYWLPGSLFIRIGASLLIAVGAVLAGATASREVFALGVVSFSLLSPLTYTYYFVAVLPAVVLMVAIEFEQDGLPSLPLFGLFLLAVHSYGLKFIVDVLPHLLSMETALRPLFPALQPGLWGNVLLVGLAALRVSAYIDVPRMLR